jgi:hypothetical protein
MSKKQFEMTQDEFEEIKSIAQDSTPVMKFGDYWSGMDKYERANAFWKILADKYGFVWDSAEGAGDDPKQFLATPK